MPPFNFEDFPREPVQPEPTASPNTGQSFLSDEDVLRLARKARNADKFIRLFDRGDIGDFKSHSEADHFLCRLLAFWCGGDREQIDRLFRSSSLCREKWTKRTDYRERTITSALEGMTQFYAPKQRTNGKHKGDVQTKPPVDEPRHQANHSAQDGPQRTREQGGTNSQTDAQTEPINDPAEENSDDEAPKPSATLRNAVRVIRDRKLINIWFDDFLRRPMTGDPAREWVDGDDLELNVKLQGLRGFSKIGLKIVQHAVTTVALRNRKNCVKDWLESLRWDGIKRIDHFFEKRFGAEATPYTRAASRNFWLSIVARVYCPGCQCDHMIILEGQQGIGKSAALRIIGGEYFTEQHESATGKGFFEVLQGKLLVEISELDSFNRAEVTRVKQVVTCTSDRYRDPYSHRATDHPRQCVFVGTTNSDSWNRDESGARRFWPIACSGEVDLNEIRTSRDQCFAEAVHRYKAGESWWTMPLEDTRTEQESRYEEDAWSEPIWKYLGPRSQVTVFEILTECLQIDEGDIQKADQMRVATCLKRLQWRRGKLERFGEGRVRFWRPNDEK